MEVLLAGLQQTKETRTIKTQLSDKRKPPVREPRISHHNSASTTSRKQNKENIPTIKKEVPSSPPVADDFDNMDYDMMDFDDDSVSHQPPSSPSKAPRIKKEEEDDDMAPTTLHGGKRAALVNKKAVSQLDIKPDIKLSSSPPLGVAMEAPDASEWLDINSALNKTSSETFENPSKISIADVTDDPDNCQFFWMDYREFGDALALFGKTKTKEGKFVSSFVYIPNFKRELYFLPRPFKVINNVETEEPVEISDVYTEVAALLQKMGVSEFASKDEERKYCFELPDVPREATYLKVLYNYSRTNQLPMDHSGQTFSRVFGTNTNIFENFVLSREIMGPCWLTLKNVAPLDQVSWCSLEAKVSSPMDITPVPENDAPPAPPMTLMAISLRTVMNHSLNKQEIVTISARVYPNVAHDVTTPAEKLESIAFTLTRPPTEKERTFLVEKEADRQNKGAKTVWDLRTEEAVLTEFLNRMQKYDPDVLIGHSLENTHFNILAHRINDKKIQGWSRLGRYHQRGNMPPSFAKSGNFFAQRQLAIGRLMCDISNVFGKSLTLKCNSWTLSEMCEVYLNQVRYDQPVDCSTTTWIKDASSLYQFLSQNETDTHFIAAIALKLQMLPLSKQLTNLAGNSWARTLLGTRAERNEYILLHQFYKQGYIVPDKGGNQPATKTKAGMEEDEELEGEIGTKKKDKYKGGLVFEPEKGLYDHIILVMDFNSLYPSIIQEYNICFTTVERNQATQDPNEEEQPPEVPDGSIPLGIFPRLVQNLVQRRRAVKSNMKDPKATSTQKAQWDIKQQALKLTANSMYGCLGYTKSRFYARPLAVLTTFKGREILTNTKELAESNGLKVIYGDTDSVMINTNVDVYEEALKIGNDFKRQVNERYRLLEIDTDNVFRRMLLHAKKKYAAVNMSMVGGKLVTSIDVKGLDMKRREYCVLAKEASQFALNQILGDKSSDEALEQIHDYLRELATNVRENNVPFVKLIIRNKLGKRPQDYPNGNTMPHVQVAKRRIEQGDSVKIDDVIAFIISDEDAQTKHVAQRAYTLNEIMSSGNRLKPDPDYYLTKQILPPLERLCAPIEGTDAVRLADCLGLDTEKYRLSHVARTDFANGRDFMPFQSTIGDAERFRDAANLKIRCMCDNVFTFAGITSTSGKRVTAEGIKCDECTRTVGMTMVNAQLEAQVRQQIAVYYAGWAVCDECHARTRQVGVYGKRCISTDSNQKRCTGVMSFEYSDLKMYNQLLYYDSLFDVDKAKKRAETQIKQEDSTNYESILSAQEIGTLAEQNRQRFQVPRQVVEKYLVRCGRRYVDMHNIFNFV